MANEDIIRLLLGFPLQKPFETEQQDARSPLDARFSTPSRFPSFPMSQNVVDRRFEQEPALPPKFPMPVIPPGPWPETPQGYNYNPPPLSAPQPPQPPPMANLEWPFVGANRYNADIGQAANTGQFSSVMRRLMGIPDVEQ